MAKKKKSSQVEIGQVTPLLEVVIDPPSDRNLYQLVKVVNQTLYTRHPRNISISHVNNMPGLENGLFVQSNYGKEESNLFSANPGPEIGQIIYYSVMDQRTDEKLIDISLDISSSTQLSTLNRMAISQEDPCGGCTDQDVFCTTGNTNSSAGIFLSTVGTTTGGRISQNNFPDVRTIIGRPEATAGLFQVCITHGLGVTRIRNAPFVSYAYTFFAEDGTINNSGSGQFF